MTARDDYRPASTDGMCSEAVWGPMCDEIDRLRAVRDAAKTLTDRCWERRSTSGIDDLLAALWRSLPEDHQ